MPPEERRAAIVAATVPLVYEHGYAVSTRQIAAAAGVAEGTLFRAFPDKQSLLDAAVAKALDPQQGVRALDAIDPSRPLDERVTMAVEILRYGIERTWQLFAALRATEKDARHQEAMRNFSAWDLLITALAKVVEPDAYRLTVPPPKAARVLGTMVIISARHLGVTTDRASTLTTAETVDVLLHGLVRPDPHDENLNQQNGSSTC